jgi:hypothetical protein
MVELYKKEEGKKSMFIESQRLTISHLFEFKNLKRSDNYEIVLSSLRPMVDRRHESTVRIPVDHDPNNSIFFMK